MSQDDKQSEALLPSQSLLDHERLELLDLLLEAGADGFFDWQLADGTIVYSARFRLILGYEDEAFPETPWAWLDLTHPEDRNMVAKGLEDLTAGDWPFDLTFRMKHRVTGWRWLRARAATRRDAMGTATRIVAVFSDVSAQVRAEKRQMSLINAVPDLLIRVQNDSTIVDLRVPEDHADCACELPNPGDKLCNSPFANGWSNQAELALETAIKERRAARFEAKRSFPLQPGNSCDIEVRVFPTSDDESLFVIRDITADKQQREQGLQSQKLEAIGQLAAGIAHEINTPLQFVGDNLHFLAEAAEAFTSALVRYRQCVPEALAPSLDEVDASLDIDYMSEHLKPAFAAALDGVQRVSTIVQAMKSFSHPGAKETRPEDLIHALETTLIISTNVWKYVADVERDFAAELPKVDCVIGQVNQVFLNLITNAAHAIGDVVGESGAKGLIRITTHSDGDSVEIRITDSGRGIPESVQPRIFEPFFTTKPVGKGTGQGLPLARAIVLQHRGSLDFETVEGRGTTFIIRLPITAVATPADAAPTSP
jgi:signal transduction histidine kinase